MTIEEAIEVFVRGFTFTRSYTHPYAAERVESVWILRDRPRRRGPYRTEEHIACGVAPEGIHAISRTHSQGSYRTCVIRAADEDDAPIRAGFRSLRYRLMGTEPLMVHGLQGIAAAGGPFPVVRVTTAEQAQVLAKAAGRRQILPEHLSADPPPVRQYMAVNGEVPVGWAASIVAGDATWCSSMFVQPQYRRRGIARSILNRMLADDRDSGARASVLLASHTGALLYRAVGYEQIGELLMYCPPRR